MAGSLSLLDNRRPLFAVQGKLFEMIGVRIILKDINVFVVTTLVEVGTRTTDCRKVNS